MSNDSKIRIKFEGLNLSYGHYRFEPDCPITKAIAFHHKRHLVKLDLLTMILQNGGRVEYSGVKTKFLDDLGMVFIGKKKEETT